MPKAKTLIITIVSILFILMLISAIIFFGFTRQSAVQFVFGFSPFGESPNQITNLAFKTDDGITLFYTSKFWDIEQRDLRAFGSHPQARQTSQTFKGSDLNFISSPAEGWTSIDGTRIVGDTRTTLISTEDFSERDFQVTFTSQPDGGGQGLVAGTNIILKIEGDSGERILVNHNFENVVNPSDLNVVIHPSVVSNKISVFVNGKQTTQIDYVGLYKIKIEMVTKCGSFDPGTATCRTTITMKEPSFKQQFGCTKETGEQFYVSFFNEGDNVNLNKLSNFKKFCLVESPLKIFSNIGSTTNTEVLEGLVNEEEFNVPEGQIWSIEYIGDLTSFVTECEEGQVLSNTDGICLARTVVTLQCPEGTDFNSDKGYCVIETEPILYQTSEIATHQKLEETGKFRFTHIVSDSQSTTSSSFSIGQTSFFSGGISYVGSLVGNINYPTDMANWFTSFSTDKGVFEGKEGNIIQIDDFTQVEITDMEAFRSSQTSLVEDFKVEYTFNIDTRFIEVSYSKDEIKINNNYQSFDGGIVLTTTNNLGTTNVETIEKELVLGETIFSIDSTNLIEAKVRPFLKIESPKFTYKIDAENALTINDFEATISQSGTTTQAQDDTPINMVIVFIGIGIVVAFIITMIVLGIRRRR